jgi:2,3-bisphosphoglycerate-independent phosphoglycerate mutase
MGTQPVVLVILDGWGIALESPGNAISAANTPNMDSYIESFPNTALRCSGEDVGLPEGQMGNSEVGHINIGAGFVVYQSITRIDRAIRDGSFARIEAFQNALDHITTDESRIHLIGLVGEGGVHAHHRHWRALLERYAEIDRERLIVHAIMDGRDTEPTSGVGFLQTLLDDMNSLESGRLGTICGRYFAMDRDKRWDRTRRAWDAIVHGKGRGAENPTAAMEESYENGTTDEFIEPIVLGSDVDVRDSDAVVFVNFRADRMRQLVTAMSTDDFDEFDRGATPSNLAIVTMTQYEVGLPVEIAFPPEDVENPLAKVISDAGLRQYHLAETEKYAHVTYFINGGREEPFPGEDREMIPSPDVATYDLKPEMSANDVTSAAVDAIQSGQYQFVVINYANGDMVGHTGDFNAAVRAVESVDAGLGRVVDATLASSGAVIVTADHGNAEEMLIPGTSDVWTAHTLNPVPIVLIASDGSPLRSAIPVGEGRLSDIAPTVLRILGLDPPDEMTGRNLFSISDQETG